MPTPVSAELRAQIISAIKGGMSINEAAEANQILPRTISKWMRKLSSNPHVTTNELQKAQKRIDVLERAVLDLYLEKVVLNKKG